MRVSHTDSEIDSMKREISIIEWDLNNIQDEKLKALKQARLSELRKSLSLVYPKLPNGGAT